MFGLLAQAITVGAHAVGLATHATPAMQGKDLTEAYLTQPALMAHATLGPFEFNGMLNFEGLTLRRGELNAGVWGEGYVDRRHPHTYLHEAMLTYQADVLSGSASLSAGRGFAPFGTDDPMVRHFVKYPSNHHLSQILERLVVSAAVQRGPIMLEAGLFSGAEPWDPEDFGSFDKFGDSWSGRATLLPRKWIELQGSLAHVTSPEDPQGIGLDHDMWNVSARVEREFANTNTYVLVEMGATAETNNGNEVFRYETILAEAAAKRGEWQVALRFERSVRPEEEREGDLFRTLRPHSGSTLLGTTRWTSGGVQVARSFQLGQVAVLPFLEATRLHAQSLDDFPVLPPENLYGSANMWSFSVGIRSTIGSWHNRMGRYGAGRVAKADHHH